MFAINPNLLKNSQNVKELLLYALSVRKNLINYFYIFPVKNFSNYFKNKLKNFIFF